MSCHVTGCEGMSCHVTGCEGMSCHELSRDRL